MTETRFASQSSLPLLFDANIEFGVVSANFCGLTIRSRFFLVRDYGLPAFWRDAFLGGDLNLELEGQIFAASASLRDVGCGRERQRGGCDGRTYNFLQHGGFPI